MEWEKDALKRVERVPFFIRGKVKKAIEEQVAKRGGLLVTSGDVDAARRELAGGLTGEGRPAIEDLLEKGSLPEGPKSRCHEVKVCGGAHGCPLSVIDDSAVSRHLFGLLEKSGLGGPAFLYHHKFRVALSGCPNACSQPQITDLGVIGQSRPARGEESCSNCRACLEHCREDAIHLAPEGPEFDYERCVNCGSCIRSCPCGAIAEDWSGFKVLAGGKLGRHPRLADTLLDKADADQVTLALEGALRLYMEQRLEGERFAGLVERLGIERVRESIFPRLYLRP